MTAWPDLRVYLADLENDQRRPLRGWPMPSRDEERIPPFHIDVAVWASDVAAELDERFGRDVDVHCGYLHYSLDGPCSRPERLHARSYTQPPLMDPSHLSARPEEEIVVSSGQDLMSRLRVTNFSSREVVAVTTGGAVNARVLDPVTWEFVGGSYIAVGFSRVSFRVAPHDSVVIPLRVGTVSYKPTLGFAIPSGAWAIDVFLSLEGGETFRSLPHPITIT